MNPLIMVSGVTRPEDAALVRQLGASHVACDLFADSARLMTIERAREVLEAASGLTGLLAFRAIAADVVIETARQTGAHHVRLAGYKENDAEACEKAGLTVYRVHEVPTGSNILPPMIPEPTVTSPAILTVSAGVIGLTFPWEILGNQAPEATFIGGGVTPENVCALLTHHPFGIAVCSGIEREPGVLDPDRTQLFFDTLANGL